MVQVFNGLDVQTQRREFIDLEAQQIQPRGAIGAGRFERLELLVEIAEGAKGRRDRIVT
jgi:hypothetical protein